MCSSSQHCVKDTNSKVSAFYTDVNKLEEAGYKSENLNKVTQSSYETVQKVKLYAILMELLKFSEPYSYRLSICIMSCFIY